MPLKNILRSKVPSPHRRVNTVNTHIHDELDKNRQLAGVNSEIHEAALERIYKILHELRLVSRPEIETKIDIFKPYRQHKWPLVQTDNWAWWRPPGRATSLSMYAHGREPQRRETHFRVLEEEVPGWVFPYILGGREMSPTKDVPMRNKPAALIVVKEPKGDRYRSWIGGVEAYNGKTPTLFTSPERIATGDTIAHGFQGGPHGDNAIEGMTATIDPALLRHQIHRRWQIGSKILSHVRYIDEGIGDELRARLPAEYLELHPPPPYEAERNARMRP